MATSPAVSLPTTERVRPLGPVLVIPERTDRSNLTVLREYIDSSGLMGHSYRIAQHRTMEIADLERRNDAIFAGKREIVRVPYVPMRFEEKHGSDPNVLNVCFGEAFMKAIKKDPDFLPRSWFPQNHNDNGIMDFPATMLCIERNHLQLAAQLKLDLGAAGKEILPVPEHDFCFPCLCCTPSGTPYWSLTWFRQTEEDRHSETRFMASFAN